MAVYHSWSVLGNSLGSATSEALTPCGVEIPHDLTGMDNVAFGTKERSCPLQLKINSTRDKSAEEEHGM